MSLSKYQKKLSKVNNNIIRFYEENNIDDIKKYRYFFTYYSQLKGPSRETYFATKHTTYEVCKAANKAYFKSNRLEKTKQKIITEIDTIKQTVDDDKSPTSVMNTTSFFTKKRREI